MIMPIYRCKDGFCGADDCSRCHPEWVTNNESEEDDDEEYGEVNDLVGWIGSTHPITY